MAEKTLTKRDLEQTFKGFEKRVVDQFHIISEGLVDQIKLLAEGHSGIIERLALMERENERQHQETRSLVKLSFAECIGWPQTLRIRKTPNKFNALRIGTTS